ncbi:hypothetical protein ABBQ32_008883 [Trebouxia sp. C0010 RCD-2024]
MRHPVNRGSGSGLWVGCGTGLLGAKCGGGGRAGLGRLGQTRALTARHSSVGPEARCGCSAAPRKQARRGQGFSIVLKAGTQQDIGGRQRYKAVTQHAGGKDQLALLYWADLRQTWCRT